MAEVASYACHAKPMRSAGKEESRMRTHRARETNGPVLGEGGVPLFLIFSQVGVWANAPFAKGFRSNSHESCARKKALGSYSSTLNPFIYNGAPTYRLLQ